ncbi:acriflavin resistance protein A [Nitrobacter sp. Nb-311A]|uniref:efflux RND transporter periplasmic adaptor subunit n=1 Tax=unclassified Nitrobacter TaxID=2620411 RepID=UPI0000685381|nr:efflux RND transporter periplasmic adaptor subunit [Nitrobacter sp. Nb-311A]EAQ33573.1 acriflavin resistance protein A [Nitrobacter sp. Nb-311A]
MTGVIALALAAGGWYAASASLPAKMADYFNGKADEALEKPGEPEIKVKVAIAETREVPIAFTYTGTIVAEADALLQARVTGVVMDRPFQPGSHVRKGQLLFRIDPRPFEVALQAAKAQQEQAKAQLEFAQAEVHRTKTLAGKGFATEQRLQQLQANHAAAAARLHEAEAMISRQNLNLDFAAVNAPFEGRASLSQINVGDLVTENQTALVSVVQLDPIDVQMALSSDDSEALRRAMTQGRATVTILDDKGEPVREAEVYQLDNRFDPRTDRRLVRASIANSDERFLPGQFVRAQIRTGTERKLLVPTIALSAQLAQQIVHVVDADGRVQQRSVTTDGVFGDSTAIVAGLSGGERIVVDHLQEMRQGLRVAVQEAGGPVSSEAISILPGRTKEAQN